MIITYEGQQYPFSMDDITVQQALKIEKFMGCSFAEWAQRLEKGGDLAARQALGWLILHGGDGTAIADTDFKMVALGSALDAAFAAEAAAQQESAGPVPTSAASTGQTPEAASSPESSQPSSAVTSS